MAVAIVLAAGVGSRMNSVTPKQFMKLMDKEIICYSLDIFQADSNVTDIVLVTGEEHISYCKKKIVDFYGYTKVRAVISGGKERYNSVYNGILEAEKIFNIDNGRNGEAKVVDGVNGRNKESDKMAEAYNMEGCGKDELCETAKDEEKHIVMIHDGARPFVTHRMISDSVECIKNGFTGCTVAMPVKDTVKIVKSVDGHLVGDKTPDRSTLYQIQTPQTFLCDALHRAYNKMLADENHKITDDTMLLERYMGQMCAIVEGAYENIKITTPEDLIVGEIFAKKI